MTASELQDMLVAALARRCGGTQRRWRLALGPVRALSIDTHPHCNWAVRPEGSAYEIAEIEALLDRVRLTHPIVDTP
ncbi:hypothetical protein [Sphingomonas sp. AX6]|uniref:hypothetical protein n=1 Tax=Sphingomonas sp. AX6 TaxID=2653171 RepID=UPI001357A835|nr:hypothetical protein [Sphingomonas sp. AX6]